MQQCLQSTNNKTRKEQKRNLRTTLNTDDCRS